MGRVDVVLGIQLVLYLYIFYLDNWCWFLVGEWLEKEISSGGSWMSQWPKACW